MLDIIVGAMLLVGYIILFLGIFLQCLAGVNFLKVRRYNFDYGFRPTFSLVVPAHNEESVIERTIKKFIETSYPNDKKEMIIVNDGSKDKTEEIVRKYASVIIDFNSKKVTKTKGGRSVNLKFVTTIKFKRPFSITLVNRGDGGHGKAHALNDGIKYAKGEILFLTDADVQLSKNSFERAARHFGDSNVGAVAGYVQVKQKRNLINQLLDFEYVTGQKILRRGFNVLGLHYIIPGGCAVIRKSVLDNVGIYHTDTLAEDTDMSWRILTETNKAIHFDPSIIVTADEPTSLLSLWNQRVRWTRGNLEVTWKNRHKVGKSKYGIGLTWGYPFWISSIILPFAFVLSACGLILATMYGIESNILPIFGKFLSVSFYVSWMLGVLLNKGKSWFAGLVTPGIPLLASLTSMFFWSNGIAGLFDYIGTPQLSSIMGLVAGLWIFIAIPGTYLCIKLARRLPNLAGALQVGVFGYWMLLITSIFHGYVAEMTKKDRTWIRTVR
jgi:cellulose synthase/poly-beta-1,6-N-acetylglucosamine synthase-like glycosyltransferase